MQIVIHNSVNMYMEYFMQLIKDNNFSLECIYCGIYCIVINKYCDSDFLLLFSTIQKAMSKELVKTVDLETKDQGTHALEFYKLHNIL